MQIEEAIKLLLSPRRAKKKKNGRRGRRIFSSQIAFWKTGLIQCALRKGGGGGRMEKKRRINWESFQESNKDTHRRKKKKLDADDLGETEKSLPSSNGTRPSHVTRLFPLFLYRPTQFSTKFSTNDDIITSLLCGGNEDRKKRERLLGPAWRLTQRSLTKAERRRTAQNADVTRRSRKVSPERKEAK